ncbi:alpha/beta hydrolase [Streptomyces sp. NPDC057445]|uniref:alpha/beta hydrolase n=1 Tax=Streptomyces sp. NPDC057445 TaxID=3346136 RepID=UPI0036AEB3FA
MATTAALVPTVPVHATTTPATSLHFGACPESMPVPAAPDRVECGWLSVPLDRERPDGERISIAVSRVRASGPPEERRGILLVNPGGPGGPGLAYAVTKRAKLPERVRRSYDVIGFDPRGTGQSAPADCGPMGGLFDSPGAEPVPSGHTEEKAYLDSLRRMADDCAAGVGDALEHLSTTQTARDMDAIRSALGERRIGFLGVSYGSYLGAAYAALFPQRVGRMALDSVVGPGKWHDFDLRQSRALLRQREVFFAWAARYEERFGLGGSAGRVRDACRRARQGLAARPVNGFGPAEFDRAVYRALGRTERWEDLAAGIHAYLHDGDIRLLRPAAPFDGTASRTYEAANRVVKCADGRGPTPGRVTAGLRRLRGLDPQPIVTGIEASTCAYWHHIPARGTRLGSPAAPPVLLIASEHDPVTPVEGARRLRQRLPGSRLVTLHDDYSHGVFASRGNACVDSAAAAYLVDGTVPATDVHCVGPGLPTPRVPDE